MSYHYWTGTTAEYRHYWRERYNAISAMLAQESYEPFPYKAYIALVGAQFHRYGHQL